MQEPLAIEIRLDVPFERAIEAARLALKAEGFGILTEIDLQSIFKEKVGRDFRPFVILGACNPPLAFSAISTDARVGLLLPCNVTVEALPEGGSVIRLTNPVALLQQAPGGSSASPAVMEVASDARARMSRVEATLGAAHSVRT